MEKVDEGFGPPSRAYLSVYVKVTNIPSLVYGLISLLCLVSDLINHIDLIFNCLKKILPFLWYGKILGVGGSVGKHRPESVRKPQIRKTKATLKLHYSLRLASERARENRNRKTGKTENSYLNIPNNV